MKRYIDNNPSFTCKIKKCNLHVGWQTKEILSVALYKRKNFKIANDLTLDKGIEVSGITEKFDTI